MKVLTLLPLFACAIAAPSGTAPIILSAIPTVDPGDIEAAAINAKVFNEDQARHFADQARALSEQAVEANQDKTTELTDQVKEKSEETFWSVEDKKWQALDAVKTAEAKLDGAVASNADAIAKSAFGVVVPYVAPAPITPVISPLPLQPISPILTPLIYNPGQIKGEIFKKDEKKEGLIDTKTIEGEKKDEKLEGDKLKLAELEKKPLAITPFFVAPVGPLAPGLKLGQPILPAPLVPLPYAVPTPLLNQW